MDEDFGAWFRRMLSENNLVDDRYDVKGMLIYRGGAMRIIRQMTNHLENLLEKDGHEPTNFPLLIPKTLLEKEKDHIAGFEDQVYWITHAGKNKLDRQMALRPTSETIMYPMFALWVRTYTDLPIKVHQSVSVYRYETKQTRPLIRSREFLWNEGHTAFATRQEALANIEKIKEIYTSLINELLCLPIEMNQRPDWDKFPGAEYTIAFETLMPDGKTLQVATIHNLGQHFSKVFGIVYDDEKGEKHHVWQTSYGPGFGRLLAATIAVHGDEKGMVIPPKVAPTQVMIIPIMFKDSDQETLKRYIDELKDKLKEAGIRVEVDESDERPGAKHFKWEKAGIPVRIEVGPRDVQNKQVVVVRRDNCEKKAYGLGVLDVASILYDMQSDIRKKAQERFDSRRYSADTLVALEEKLGQGIVSVGWCNSPECVKSLDEKGTILTITDEANTCIVCGKDGKNVKMAKTY